MIVSSTLRKGPTIPEIVLAPAACTKGLCPAMME
jgi:hypothetical protein